MSLTISAPGRHLSLPKSVAAVGVEAWNRKAREGVDARGYSAPVHELYASAYVCTVCTVCNVCDARMLRMYVRMYVCMYVVCMYV